MSAFKSLPLEEVQAQIPNIVAGADLSAKVGYAAGIASGRTATLATNAAAFDGIITEGAASGLPVSIRAYGLAFAIVNGNSVNIAKGDLLVPTTGGVFIKLDEDTGGFYSGIAREAATTDGAKILVLIAPGYADAPDA